MPFPGHLFRQDEYISEQKQWHQFFLKYKGQPSQADRIVAATSMKIIAFIFETCKYIMGKYTKHGQNFLISTCRGISNPYIVLNYIKAH